jgi:hypothetical protein
MMMMMREGATLTWEALRPWLAGASPSGNVDVRVGVLVVVLVVLCALWCVECIRTECLENARPMAEAMCCCLCRGPACGERLLASPHHLHHLSRHKEEILL